MKTDGFVRQSYSPHFTHPAWISIVHFRCTFQTPTAFWSKSFPEDTDTVQLCNVQLKLFWLISTHKVKILFLRQYPPTSSLIPVPGPIISSKTSLERFAEFQLTLPYSQVWWKAGFSQSARTAGMRRKSQLLVTWVIIKPSLPKRSDVTRMFPGASPTSRTIQHFC